MMENYGPFFIRLVSRGSGSYHESDGCGSCAGVTSVSNRTEGADLC